MCLSFPKNRSTFCKNFQSQDKKTRHINSRISCDDTKNAHDPSLGEVDTEDLLSETSLLEDVVNNISEKLKETDLVEKKENEEKMIRHQIEDKNAEAHAIKQATRKKHAQLGQCHNQAMHKEIPKT